MVIVQLLLPMIMGQFGIQVHPNPNPNPYPYPNPNPNLNPNPNPNPNQPYNAKEPPEAAADGAPPPRATAVEQLKPYSNTCGLFALAPSEMSALAEYRRAIAAATAQHPPAYD